MLLYIVSHCIPVAPGGMPGPGGRRRRAAGGVWRDADRVCWWRPPCHGQADGWRQLLSVLHLLPHWLAQTSGELSAGDMFGEVITDWASNTTLVRWSLTELVTPVWWGDHWLSWWHHFGEVITDWAGDTTLVRWSLTELVTPLWWGDHWLSWWHQFGEVITDRAGDTSLVRWSLTEPVTPGV